MYIYILQLMSECQLMFSFSLTVIVSCQRLSLTWKSPTKYVGAQTAIFFFFFSFSFLCRRVKEQKTVVLLFRFSVNSIVIICCHLLCLFPLFDRDCCCDLFYKQTNKGNETGFKWLPELTKTETSLTLKVLAYPEQRENPAANCVYLCILWKANPFRVTPRATPLFTLGDFSLGVSVFCCCCCFGWFFLLLCVLKLQLHTRLDR